VPVLTSHVDLQGETYRANRAAQLALLDELDKQLEQAIAGGGERYQQRHRDRGRLLARERIELLVERRDRRQLHLPVLDELLGRGVQRGAQDGHQAPS